MSIFVRIAQIMTGTNVVTPNYVICSETIGCGWSIRNDCYMCCDARTLAECYCSPCY